MQYGGDLFSTVPLHLEQWALCVAFGVGTLVVRAGLLLLPEPEPQVQGQDEGGPGGSGGGAAGGSGEAHAAGAAAATATVDVVATEAAVPHGAGGMK